MESAPLPGRAPQSAPPYLTNLCRPKELCPNNGWVVLFIYIYILLYFYIEYSITKFRKFKPNTSSNYTVFRLIFKLFSEVQVVERTLPYYPKCMYLYFLFYSLSWDWHTSLGILIIVIIQTHTLAESWIEGRMGKIVWVFKVIERWGLTDVSRWFPDSTYRTSGIPRNFVLIIASGWLVFLYTTYCTAKKLVLIKVGSFLHCTSGTA